jgi:hypothetical protein
VRNYAMNFDKEAKLEQFRAERAELEASIEERLRNRPDQPIDEVQAWRERRKQWVQDRVAEARERERAKHPPPPADSDPVVEGATMLMFGDRERGEALADLLADMMATAQKEWRADIERNGFVDDGGFALHLKRMREVYGPDYQIKTYINPRPGDDDYELGALDDGSVAASIAAKVIGTLDDAHAAHLRRMREIGVYRPESDEPEVLDIPDWRKPA